MHCQACDCELSDYESVRKDQHGGYVDLCSTCYQFTKDDALSLENEISFYIDKED